MIEIVDLCKSYRLFPGRKIVLQNANLSVPEPVSFGILGRNGAGKSTLMKLISGSLPPDSGYISRTGMYSWPLGLRGLGGTMTGADNCDFIASVYGVNRKELREFVLDYSELGDYFYRPTRTYSAGMKARLSFGICMAIQFDVYLIDEGTATGDKRFKKKAQRLFEERTANAKVIVVSHSDRTIKKMCDYAAVLERGELTELMPLKKALAIHSKNMETASDDLQQPDEDDDDD